jgi:hypothetical protein
MRIIISALGYGVCTAMLLAMSPVGISKQALAIETVTLLDRGEPYASMVADSGVLWVAQNRLNFNTNYRLQAFSSDGRLMDEVQVRHVMWNMSIASPGTIIMTGLNPDSRLTNYTTARLEGGKIKLRTSEIALGGYINFWIATLSGKHYFADMGGNPQDDQVGLPAQTIFASTGTNARYLSTRLRMPRAGLAMNNKLYIVSHEAMGSPRSSLVEVDPLTMQKRILTASTTAAYTDLKILPGTTDLVSIARDENKIVIVNSQLGQIRRQFRTKGYTRSFDFYGHCVLAGDDENNIIEIFDLKSDSEIAFMAEEIDLPASEFSGIKSIAVDKNSGAIFARASLACNPMVESCDTDKNRVVTFGAEAAARLRTACNNGLM